MRIAVSIPDDVFRAAERYARRAGKSRSQLYAEALSEYLSRHAPDEVTEAMDHVIDHLTEPADSFVTAKRHRILLTLNMNRIVRHLWAAIRHENAATLVPIFDSEKPIRSTGDMLPWYTGRPWADTEHSHINRCVFDSAWEASEAFALDRHPDVTAWAKNDHLGFVVCVRRCRPQVSTRFPRAAPDGTHARRRSEGPGLAPERGEAGRLMSGCAR